MIFELSVSYIYVVLFFIFKGNIHAQGSLILQDILQVTDYKAKTKPAKRRVFVFEQMIIFTEPFERKTDWTVFIYRHSIKVSGQTKKIGFQSKLKRISNCVFIWCFQTNFMGITDNYADDPCKFALWTHTSQNEIYVLKAETPKDKIKWIKTLRQLLEHLKQFANGKNIIVALPCCLCCRYVFLLICVLDEVVIY